MTEEKGTYKVTELKPCPFCGQKSRERYTQVDLFSCSNINCELCHVVFSAKEWNTRPIEDALTAENAKLRELLERVDDEFTFYISKYLGVATPDGVQRYANIHHRVQSLLEGGKE
jgi:hypothetical protein